MTQREPPNTLIAADLPPLFHLADARAVAARRHYISAMVVQISLLLLGVIAATVAASTGVRQLSLIGIGAFLLVAALRLYIRFSTLETSWYQERVAAESIKSLAWRYAMGAIPFPLADEDHDTSEEFAERLRGVLTEVRPGALPSEFDTVRQITAEMTALRTAPISARQPAYDKGRARDQVAWYQAKADSSARQARAWDALFVAGSVLAIIFGMLQVFASMDVNLLGIMGFGVSLIGTWTGIHHYSALERRYHKSAAELEELASSAEPFSDEEAWSAFVDDAEGLISHEHSAWRLARTEA